MSTQALSIRDKYDEAEMVRTLKETVCKGATDAQFRMLVEVARATGLNPLLREVWFVPGVGVMAGRDGYLRVANDHPQFDGMETSVERDAAGIPIKATCRVWRKDRGHPVTCEAYYNEYKKESPVWKTYKSAMISKVAEVLALKRSFSINGVVTEEEIGHQEPQGSQEAQQQVAQTLIAEGAARNFQRQIAQPIETGTTFIDMGKENVLEMPEKRHAERQQEAEAVIAEAAFVPMRPKGDIGFKALDEIKKLKESLVELTGSTDLYYEALKAFGANIANQLNQYEGKQFWKALKEMDLRLAQEKTEQRIDRERRDELTKQMERVGVDKFMTVLGAMSFESLSDMLTRATVEQESDILQELKAL